jgi:MORN repeat
MTAFPTIRPPRQSPATAYLQHLQQKKTGRTVPLADYDETAVDNNEDSSSPQSVVLRKMALGSPPAMQKPRLGSRARSTGTMATCASVCSDNASDEQTGGNSANSSSSLGEGEHGRGNFPLSFPDDFVASTGACSTAETALVPRSNEGKTRRDPPPPPSRPLSPTTSQLVSTLLGEDEDPAATLAMLQLLEEDDDDSIVALDRLLSETSRRWSDTTRKTHREFCRLSFCPCREQATIIAKQAQEIALLKDQLQQAEEEVFPLEQIEVYHDNDDHCSVTSGLTQQYDSASFATGQIMLPAHPASQARPDADSVTGTQSVHQAPLPSPPAQRLPVPPQMQPSQQVKPSNARKAPLLPPSIHDSKPPIRARNRVVALTAADGTTRRAVYSGDVSTGGEPNGCGVLRFSSGDLYMGQVHNGQMHGQGTFVVNRKAQRAPEVLKGTFERNVYTG